MKIDRKFRSISLSALSSFTYERYLKIAARAMRFTSI